MKSNEFLLARAGGGDQYVAPSTSSHSSSSSSSSSNFNSTNSNSSYNNNNSNYNNNTSSGSSSGGIFGFIFIGIIIVIFVGLFLYSKKSSKKQPQNTFASDQPQIPIAPVIPQASASNPQTELAKIIARDPAFSEQEFKDKTENAFFKIQEAWESQNLEIARPYVSEAILQRYSNQISDMKSRNERDVMENIVIGAVSISAVSSDASHDYITVRIDASAADYTIDAAGAIVHGSKQPTPFTEYWTMMRTAGATTATTESSQGQKCPSCGAPLQTNATGKCIYCGTVVASGHYDWILSEIKQA